MIVSARLTDAPDDWLEAGPRQLQLTAQLIYVGPEVILINDFPNCDRISRICNRLEFSGWNLFVKLKWTGHYVITKVSSVLSYRDRTDEDAEVRKGEDARDRTGDVYVAHKIIM